MFLLHTSDWHLGQNFHGYSRLAEQELFLQWLIQQIDSLRPDALLIAGDVFDTLTPPAAAQKLLYDFYAQAHAIHPHLQVITIAGNHDSGIRLEASAAILQAHNVRVVGTIPRHDTLHTIDFAPLALPLSTPEERMQCLAVPFLRASDCPTPPPDAPHTSAEALFYQQLASQYLPNDMPHIAMGHLYAQGGRTNPNDPAELLIGGIEGCPSTAFSPNFHYVALGHLHRMQQISDTPPMYYSGSPIPMSFSEHAYKHGILAVHIEPQATPATRVEPIYYNSPQQLIALHGTPEEVHQQLLTITPKESSPFTPILSLTFTCHEPMPSLQSHLNQWVENMPVRLGPIRVEYPQAPDHTTLPYHPGASLPTPLEIAQYEYKNRFGEPLPEPLEKLFKQALMLTQQHAMPEE